MGEYLDLLIKKCAMTSNDDKRRPQKGVGLGKGRALKSHRGKILTNLSAGKGRASRTTKRRQKN